MNRFFDEIFDRSLSDILDTNFSSNVPSANIIEEDEKYEIYPTGTGPAYTFSQ